MKHRRILLIGGTGFIGRAIAARLAARGATVTVPTRRAARAGQLPTLPTAQVVEANVNDPAALARLVAGQDAVINLVGILHSRRGEPYGPDFARAHVDLPRAIAAAMKAEAARAGRPLRLLHMSALGADSAGPSMYQRSKGDGEAALRGEVAGSALALTIFRPSVVFGPEDSFLNLFAKLAAKAPVLPIGGADARFQPVFVGDVADAFVNALDDPATYGRAYELCGPKTYSLRELVAFAARASGHPRCVIGLPAVAARMQALALEFAPGGPLMSRDNLDSMKTDNVAPAGWQPAPELGLASLTPVEAAADWLPGTGRLGKLDDYRRAGQR
ncbi:complex I NDUFA9 subunit family protein [Derxia gummosa]|uniref:Complex I NDUFA9 subunit family protein n=1 Tax=Derxia gummosa DSM 723 TaxID=1121388 RepID=A0A8B6X6I8_9BURK|nr:complex I NDUFA9 subunit family protein [Derxia gummosa]